MHVCIKHCTYSCESTRVRNHKGEQQNISWQVLHSFSAQSVRWDLDFLLMFFQGENGHRSKKQA